MTPGQTALSRRSVLGGVMAVTAATAMRSVRAADAPFPVTWRFGEVTVTKVMDGLDPFDAAKAFPGAPLSAFDENASWLVPHFYDPAAKAILFSFHSYVVRTPRRTIVVETGMGNDKPRRMAMMNMRKSPYLDNLRAAGIKPEAVDVVLSSHFHSDHIGWNTRLENGRWVPTFPKARYTFNRAELAAVQQKPADPAYQDSILPVLDAGLVDIIDGDHELDRGVRIVATPGHTPGHHALAIDSQGQRAILCGDILHNPIEVLHPDWDVLFDDDKVAGKAQRVKFVDAHTDVDVTVFPAHFGGPTAGKIVTEKGGKRWFRPLTG